MSLKTKQKKMSVYQINDCNMMKFTRQKDSNICENVVTRQEKTGEKRAIFLLVGDGSAWFWLVWFKVWLYQFSFWYWKRKKKRIKKKTLWLCCMSVKTNHSSWLALNPGQRQCPLKIVLGETCSALS